MKVFAKKDKVFLTQEQQNLLSKLRLFSAYASIKEDSLGDTKTMEGMEFYLKKVNGFIVSAATDVSFDRFREGFPGFPDMLADIVEIKKLLKNTEGICLSSPCIISDVLQNLDTFIKKFEI